VDDPQKNQDREKPVGPWERFIAWANRQRRKKLSEWIFPLAVIRNRAWNDPNPRMFRPILEDILWWALKKEGEKNRRRLAAMPCRNVSRLTLPLRRQALRLHVTKNESLSYWGGLPRLPPDTPWPTAGGVPLSFVVAIDLSEAAQEQHLEWLPDRGTLLFFVDAQYPPHGSQPDDVKAWRLIYLPEGNGSYPERETPPVPANDRFGQYKLFLRKNIRFKLAKPRPSPGRSEVKALALNEAEMKRYEELFENQEGFDDRYDSYLGGYPQAIQNDAMELACQLLTHGQPLDIPHPYDTCEAQALALGASEWRLLMQIASNEKLGFEWYDRGNMFVWMREEDARAARFKKAWVITQCG